MIKFSVIVPAYKVERYLPRCIESITNQTYSKLEILLINDGSPDNCLAIMQQYASQDNRIIVISQENGGLSAARNAGLRRATGDYVAFVDSDDWIEPEMFAELEHRIVQEQPDFICFRLQYDTPDAQKSWVYGEPYPVAVMKDPESILQDTLEVRSIPTPAWSKLYKRDFLERHGLMFKPGIVNEDTLFSLQAACHATKVSFVNRVLYHTLERPGSISRSSQDRLFRDMAVALDDAKRYLIRFGRFENPQTVRTYRFRYAKSMLYNICQAAQRLPYRSFKAAHAVCMHETDYPKYRSQSAEFPRKYRILYLLSFHPRLFYLAFKLAHRFGARMH